MRFIGVQCTIAKIHIECCGPFHSLSLHRPIASKQWLVCPLSIWFNLFLDTPPHEEKKSEEKRIIFCTQHKRAYGPSTQTHSFIRAHVNLNWTEWCLVRIFRLLLLRPKIGYKHDCEKRTNEMDRWWEWKMFFTIASERGRLCIYRKTQFRFGKISRAEPVVLIFLRAKTKQHSSALLQWIIVYFWTEFQLEHGHGK